MRSVYDEKGNEIPDVIMWLGDDNPTYPAQVVLGKCKPDLDYMKRNAKTLSGNRTETDSDANNS